MPATTRSRRTGSNVPRPVRAASSAVSTGTHMRAMAATSHSRRPGAAKSKSSRATAIASLNTTFSGQTSLWHSTGWSPGVGSASSWFQTAPGGGVKLDTASW